MDEKQLFSIQDLAPAGKQLLSEEEKGNNEEVRNDGVVNDSNQDIDFLTVCRTR